MPSSYTTSTGDTWDTIAHQLWGQETLMHELLTANPQHRGTVIFPAGVVLSIPDVTPQPIEEPPPWQER
jgi:phage tail protein X